MSLWVIALIFAALILMVVGVIKLLSVGSGVDQMINGD